MNAALATTRRVTQAVLGAGVLGTVVLTGHLALSHASASATPATTIAPSQGRGEQPGFGSGQVPSRSRDGSGFSQVRGLGSGSAGGGTSTHGS